MRLTLSRVIEADLDELFECQFTAFESNDTHIALFGPNTPTARQRTKERFWKDMKEDIADCWLKLVDEDTGKIVSGSNWKIYPTRAGVTTAREGDGVKAIKNAKEDDLANGSAHEEDSEVPKHNDNGSEIDENDAKYLNSVDWYSGEERTWAATILKDFMVRRIKYTHDHAHVLLYILFTHPDYHGKGCGAIHVNWGCKLADQLMVPAWVEASKAGHKLYESYGFRDVEEVATKAGKWCSEYTMMTREGAVRAEVTKRWDVDLCKEEKPQ